MAKAALLFVGTVDGMIIFSDPGASGRWLRVGHELRGTPLNAVWPLYDEPQIVLAGGPTGIWRSEDGGVSWSEIAPTAVAAFAGDRTTPRSIRLATEQGGWQYSNDGGLHWEQDVADHSGPSMPDPRHLLLSGQQPVVLVARGNRIERSIDNGLSWEGTVSDTPLLGEVTVISAARYHIDTAFAGNSSGQLVSSSDRGRTWQGVKHDLPALRAIVATRLA